MAYLQDQKQIADSRVVELQMQRDRLTRERARSEADKLQLATQVEALEAQLAQGIRSKDQMDDVRRMTREAVSCFAPFSGYPTSYICPRAPSQGNVTWLQ